MGETTKAKAPEKKSTSGHISEQVEDAIDNLPKMNVAELSFLYESAPAEQTSTQQQLLELIQENAMAPYYKYLSTKYNWKLDQALYTKMSQENEAQLSKYDEQLKDATENLGDIEVLEALFAKSSYYSKIGDKENAIQQFEKTFGKPQSTNQKIQVRMHLIRLGLFFHDIPLIKENVEKATKLIDEGGDWDRRNRLKVYEGCYFMYVRDFAKASVLFQDSIATFTSTEVMSYTKMIFYCIISSVLSTSRVELKKKIVDCPEVLAVLNELPYISDFLNGLYDCKYRQFFQSIANLEQTIQRDMYLAAHIRCIYRELRVLSYKQFLEAYKSVRMDRMAQSFGITVDFLDYELSRFIAAGRLNAKIDKVAGVIETNRPDAKNMQYQGVVKKGDHLLNRVQQLARVISI